MTGKPKRHLAANRNGSGLRALLLVAAALAALCLLASSAFASKQVADYFGAFDNNFATNIGGELRKARDIAVNSSGAGPAEAGDIYVADTRNNRIQRFDKEGNFVSAWGADVVKDGGTGDQGDAAAKKYEICTVASQCQEGIASSGNGATSGNGSLSSPQALAVDPDTGNVYVSDQGNNRVNEYQGDGHFLRSFGWDVAAAGGPGDVAGTHEQQTVALSAGAEGLFALRFSGSTTAPIAADATPGEVKSALGAIPSISSEDNVSVTGPDGGPWTVEFTGTLGDRDVGELSADVARLSSPVGTNFTCTSPDAATTTNYRWLTDGAPSTGPGANTDTYTTVAADAGKPVQCQVFKLNANAGSTQVSSPASIVSPSPATGPPIYTPPSHRIDLPAPNPPRVKVGQKANCDPQSGWWSPGLSFSYRWYVNGAAVVGATDSTYTVADADVPGAIQCEVIATNAGGSVAKVSENRGTNPAANPLPPSEFGSPSVSVSGPSATFTTVTDGAPGGYEVCEGADTACGAGNAGSGVGQIGSTSTDGTLGLAVSDSLGELYLADSANSRVDTYDLDGANPASFGSSAQFGATQPRQVAVDSRGILYASNDANGGEIERYDSANANGGGVGFLDPITAGDSSPSAGPLLPGSPASATAGLEVDPATNALYVLRNGSSAKVVQQFGPTNDPGLTVAPSSADDVHGAGLSGVDGLGLDDSSGRLYVAATAAQVSGQRLYVLEDNVAPAANIDPASGVTAHSATLSGAVDPNGFPTGYHFEYVDDATFQADETNLGAGHGFDNAAQRPLVDADVGNGDSPLAVTQVAPHLIPGVTYHFRLIATQLFSPAQAIAGPLTFTTPGSAPSLHADATVAGAAAATLRGAINPQNQAVSDYHFNWGADASYGNTTTVGNLSSGNSPVSVSAGLSSLTPATTYHFQLVATNGTGTTTGPDRTFTTSSVPTNPSCPNAAIRAQQGAGFLPDCRAYEIASQYPTGGVPIIETTGRASVSEDGDSVAFQGLNPLPGSKLQGLAGQAWGHGSPSPQYLSERGPGGWGVGEVGPYGSAWSADLERMLVVTVASAPGAGTSFEDPRVNPDDKNGWLDVYQWRRDGTLTWISRDPRTPAGTPQTVPGPAQTAFTQGPVFTMAADGKTIVFNSRRRLLDADTATFAPSGGSGAGSLYKWEDGTLRLVGVRPDGSVPAGGASLGGPAEQGSARYAVSPDGERVVFSAPRVDDGGRDIGAEGVDGYGIYIQRDGAPTVEATKETGVAKLPAPQPYNLIYRGAAADDSRVFYTSNSRLTPDSGASATASAGGIGGDPGDADLYVYDLAANKVRDITPRLDGGTYPSVDPASADQARVQGVLANSDDGKVIYFVAKAKYDTAPNPQGQLPREGDDNLYMAKLGDDLDGPIELRFIGSLSAKDVGDWFGGWASTSGDAHINQGKTALASPDGQTLGFASYRSLTGQPLGGTEQLFVYDAEAGRLECASCPADGSLPTADVNSYFDSVSGSDQADWQGPLSIRRWVSSDGAVFFTTKTSLLAADQNVVDDVYEYRDGVLSLISSGQSTADSRLSNASPDGSTVVFNTQAALASRDKEPGIPKLYAARVDGGFPYTPPTPPCDVNAGACEGQGTSAPDQPGAGTAVFSGPGNPEPSATANPCAKPARKAKILSRRAKHLARNARRVSRKNHRRAVRMRRKAHRLAGHARGLSKRAKRCRVARKGKRANDNGRAGR